MRLERVGERVDARGRRQGGDGEHGRRAAERAQRHAAGRGPRGSATAPRSALVTTSTSGTSMIPAFRNWRTSPAPGLDDDRDGVGRLGHLRLGLADADRLDHDDVEGGRERVRGGARGGREAAEPPARRHRADEQPAVGRVGVDPRAVAEQRAARALGGRVDGEHGDGPPARAPGPRERAQQRRLARARRAGDADDVPGRLAAEPRGGDLREQRGDRVALRRARGSRAG